MLTIRGDQMQAFRRAALAGFEDEMLAHCREFSPELCNVLEESQLRRAISDSISRAESHGFANRGPIRLFIEMSLLFGSGFDKDPQYPWAGEILAEQTTDMQRAQRLYQKIIEYQNRVAGDEGSHTQAAYRQLYFLAQQPLVFTAQEFGAAMHKQLAVVFPQKAAYVGDMALQQLIQQAITQAQQANFSTSRGYALIVLLMYFFGRGCLEDPLYPWIANSLGEQTTSDSVDHSLRLEKKALTWLSHAMENLAAG